ncbi:MAG: serine protein kinase, partial [Planctomycetota bacterium]|nr:serine protein kinase [Planctomycetota bacterium]
KDDFRHELMNYIAAVHLEGEQFDHRENRRLRCALELKLFEDQRDSIQLTTLISEVVDPQVEEKVAAIRARLCALFGYDEASAATVLQDVAGLFAREGVEAAEAAADDNAEGAERAA